MPSFTLAGSVLLLALSSTSGVRSTPAPSLRNANAIGLNHLTNTSTNALHSSNFSSLSISTSDKKSIPLVPSTHMRSRVWCSCFDTPIGLGVIHLKGTYDWGGENGRDIKKAFYDTDFVPTSFTYRDVNGEDGFDWYMKWNQFTADSDEVACVLCDVPNAPAEVECTNWSVAGE